MFSREMIFHTYGDRFLSTLLLWKWLFLFVCPSGELRKLLSQSILLAQEYLAIYVKRTSVLSTRLLTDRQRAWVFVKQVLYIAKRKNRYLFPGKIISFGNFVPTSILFFILRLSVFASYIAAARRWISKSYIISPFFISLTSFSTPHIRSAIISQDTGWFSRSYITLQNNNIEC